MKQTCNDDQVRCSSRPSPDCKPLIEIRDLTVTYDRAVALRDVSWKIQRNRVAALIGPSGCGKSTLLSCINRLNELTPGCQVSGEILLHGKSIYRRGQSLRELRRRIGMISQRPTPFPLSIYNNLDLPLRDHGLGDRKERAVAIKEALHQVGLWEEVRDRLDHPANRLSGGQQQRLCIARALLLQPELLLMDEPCSSLDPLSSQRIEQLIGRLRKTTSIVIVTHSIAQARRLADDLAVMWWQNDAGELVEFGPAEELFTGARHAVTSNYLAGRTG